VNHDPLAEARRDAESPRAAVQAAVAAIEPRPGWRVLDVGCGAGVHLPLFAERVGRTGRVVGFDQDADRLAVAGELCAEAIAAGRVELRQGDLRQPPFGDGEFDLVWLSAVLHHEPEPVAALSGLRPLLALDGQIAVLDGDTGGSFPCLPWPPALEDGLRAAASRAAADGYGGRLHYHFEPYLGRALPRLLREAGLADVRFRAFAETEQAPLAPDREQELGDWFRGPFAERLADYLAPVDRERLLACFDPQHPCYLPADPDFFVARMTFLATGRAGSIPR